MKWFNLKSNKCPQCNKGFIDSAFSKRLGFIVCNCGFQITNKRYSEIVQDMEKKRIEQKYEDIEENAELAGAEIDSDWH